MTFYYYKSNTPKSRSCIYITVSYTLFTDSNIRKVHPMALLFTFANTKKILPIRPNKLTNS